MNEKEQKRRLAEVEENAPRAPLANEKESVPGQQLGLYSDGLERDVRQMTHTLNNPEEQDQESRG